MCEENSVTAPKIKTAARSDNADAANFLPALSAAATDLPRMLDGYQLIRKIGAGGMSTVFEAISPDGTAVALKLLHPSFGDTANARSRLRREVAMLQRLHGDHVAQILDAELAGENLFIVTELIEGLTLEADVQREGRYTEEDLVRLGEQLAIALSAVHDAGILHRDLKPSNVMLRGETPVLIDFGISQGGADTRLTQTGFLTHTPGFCDPRVIQGCEPDEAADWWALSAVLAYAATGVRPFGGGLPAAVMHRVLHETPDLPHLDHRIAALFRAALVPDLTQRLTYSQLLIALADPQIMPDLVDQGTLTFRPEAVEQNVQTRVLDAEMEAETIALVSGEIDLPTLQTTQETAVNSWQETFSLAAVQNEFLESSQMQIPLTEPVAQMRTPPLAQTRKYPAPNSLPQGVNQMPAPQMVSAAALTAQNPLLAQADAGSGVTDVSENFLAGYTIKPLKHYRMITLCIGVFVALIGAHLPLLTMGGVICVGAILGTVGILREKLIARRIRRGMAANSDSGILLAYFPIAFLSGILRSVFAGSLGVLSGGLLLLVGGRNLGAGGTADEVAAAGLAWFGRIVAAFTQFNGVPTLFAFAIAIVIYWFFPTSQPMRTGLRVALERLIPARRYYFYGLLLMLLAIFFVFLSGLFSSSGNSWPLW
ncbi:serine/threonine protein kinase [Arcanobacterium hippocoleae]|uniref:Serine/threonine protein kinase n=2 Tax=Arcanobacterium hippocoleae TaxID=149017 RepID=A0ABU1T354_9ACTO|nr:serine/threonine protein kinase [Arcanobacterium hippocoleae]